MIIYNSRRQCGFNVLFHRVGSALFHRHSLPVALMSAVISAICSNVPAIRNFLTVAISSDSAYFGGLSFIVAFVVVYRAQLAIQRYDKAQSSYLGMGSKILDIALLTHVWVDKSPERREECEKLVEKIMRWLRLYHELGTEEIQGFPFVARFPRAAMTTEEAVLISKTSHRRTLTVISWVLDAIAKNRGCLTCEAPMINRFYQFASEANLLFTETRRISETPFPFPFAQITVMMITIWAFLTPIVQAPFLADTYVGSVIVSFFGTWMLFAVNEAASQLEQPFDQADNDLPILNYALSFIDDLNSLSTLRCPDLNGVETGRTRAPSLSQLSRAHTFKKSFKRPESEKCEAKEQKTSALYSMFNIPKVGSSDTLSSKGSSDRVVTFSKKAKRRHSKLSQVIQTEDKREIPPSSKQVPEKDDELVFDEEAGNSCSRVKFDQKSFHSINDRVNTASTTSTAMDNFQSAPGGTKRDPKIMQLLSDQQQFDSLLKRKRVNSINVNDIHDLEAGPEHERQAMSNTLAGASGQKMLHSFVAEMKKHWRDYAAVEKPIERERFQLQRQESPRPVVLTGPMQFLSASASRRKINFDEKAPFSFLRRNGVFDRVR